MKEADVQIDKKLINEVKKEFPGDPALQNIHIARRLITREMNEKGLNLHEYILQHRINLNSDSK